MVKLLLISKNITRSSKTIICMEGCLLLIAGLDTNIVETLVYIKLGKVLSSLKFDNKLRNQQK